MLLLKNLLRHNELFVRSHHYELYETTKYPDLKLAIVTCMDTRLTKLLPAALGIKNGDAKIIKTAGAMVVSDPQDSVMRSLVVAIHELGVQEVLIVGHTDCGMGNLMPKETVRKMLQNGVSAHSIEEMEKKIGGNVQNWLAGFDCERGNVEKSVYVVKNHPLVPMHIPVHGLLICPHTGRLELLYNGYTQKSVVA